MKPNINYCVLGSAFLGSSIMTMLSSKKSKNFINFKNLLDDNQLQIYISVIKERLNIYLQGMFIGIILAIILTYNSQIEKNTRICIFIVVSLGFNYLYYSLYPKSTYMIKHLNSIKQNEAWLKIYKEMKFRNLIGIILGIIGYILIGKGWCN